MFTLKHRPAKVTWLGVRNTLDFVCSVVATRKLHFTIKPVETVSVCMFKFASFVPFGKFLTILNQVFRLNSARSTIHTTIAYCIIFYHFIFVSTTTSAVNYLSRTNTVFNMPLFLSLLVLKVGLEVRAITVAEGGIRGITNCDLDVSTVTRMLLTLSFEDYSRLLVSTPFSSYSSKSDYEFVRSKICSTLPEFTGNCYVDGELDLADEDKLYFQMFGFFTLVPSIFQAPNKCFETVDFKLDRGYSKFINVHRFRNYEDETCYIVNAQSISIIHSSSQTEFACFLRLFKPTFYQDTACVFGLNRLIPNDVLFDISAITEEQALIYLFELTRTNSTGPKKVTNNSSHINSTVRPNGGATNENIKPAEVSNDVTEKVKKYREKYLKYINDGTFNSDNGLESLINMFAERVVSIAIARLRGEQPGTYISSIETGTGPVYYYSPTKLNIPISTLENDILFSV